MNVELRRLVIYFVAILTAACGGAGGAPAAPATPTVPGATGPTVTATDVSVRNRTATFSWTPVPGASRYNVQVGAATGGTDVATLSTSETNAVVGGLAERNFVRVQAETAAGVTTSPELVQVLPDLRDVIDGLYFGRGPYVYAFPVTDFLDGFLPGAPIRVRISDVFNAAEVQTVRDMVAQANDLMAGRIVATIVDEHASGLSYPASPREVWVIRDPNTPECQVPATACTRSFTSGPRDRATVIMKTAAVGDLVTLAHEMGHALTGAGHVTLPPLPSPTGVISPLMGPNLGTGSVRPRFSPAESDAIRAVFEAGFPSGTSRSAFVGAGLVRP